MVEIAWERERERKKQEKRIESWKKSLFLFRLIPFCGDSVEQ